MSHLKLKNNFWGQIRPLLIYFRSFHMTNIAQIRSLFIYFRSMGPYAGWTLICCKICEYVCLKRPKINDKIGRGRSILKKIS